MAAGTGASIGVAALARRWFRHAIQDVIDESMAELKRQQAEFEQRQGQHQDRQDKRLQRIEEKLGRRWLPLPGKCRGQCPGLVGRGDGHPVCLPGLIDRPVVLRLALCQGLLVSAQGRAQDRF